VDHGFDPVAIGIEHERRIVIRRVLRPQPRRTIVAPAVGERRPMESGDGFPARRYEREVEAGSGTSISLPRTLIANLSPPPAGP
jgi:hypothetical protein